VGVLVGFAYAACHALVHVANRAAL